MGTKKPLLVRQGLGDAAGRELGLAGFGPERNLGVESKAGAFLRTPRFVRFGYVDASALVSARVGCFS